MMVEWHGIVCWRVGMGGSRDEWVQCGFGYKTNVSIELRWKFYFYSAKETSTMTITYRRGTLEDSHTVFQIFQQSIMELGERMGVMTISGGDDPEVLDKLWKARRSLFEHLAKTAHEYWLAEREGRAIGYSRAILRDGVQELTEFFVLPGEQSAGVGRELLARTLTESGTNLRSIIATLDERALIHYLKLGLSGRFPIKYFSRAPEPVAVKSDLKIRPIAPDLPELADLNRIDRAVIGHMRPTDHHWLVSDRQGFTYSRAGEIVGYGYVGNNSGPFTLLNPQDFPAVLSHAERVAAGQYKRFGVETPLTNRAAIDYFLARRYRMDAFTALFMSDRPFGQFENYIFFGPPLMM
jgi:GNAT superfamily N-acetyltransferase